MCGVIGVIGAEEAAKEAILGLTMLQHRGQDAAGVLSYDASEFHLVKSLGLVESVFTEDRDLTGKMAIGHVRYGTSGRGDSSEVQPFVVNYPFGIGMAHNGNLYNCAELREQLRSQNKRCSLTHSDTEVILNLFAQGLAEGTESGDDGELSFDLTFDLICSAVAGLFEKVNGSCSIVALIADGGLVAFRDPHGIRPLIWGKQKVLHGEKHLVASEGGVLSFLGYERVRDLQPGEVLFIDMNGNVHTRVVGPKRKFRPCMFEWVYFASPESVMDELPVYQARLNLGKSLAQCISKQIKERGLEADVVVPVPETARIAAIALAEELGIPYREALIKNRYIMRTFILDSQEKRNNAVRFKLSPVRSEIEGKRILLVDDSIVRGTTSRQIVELVRQAGAAKVYFVSTCPPIRYPCFYGIDFPDRNELIAADRSLDDIEKELGADAVIYQEVEGLERSLNFKQQECKPCTACLTGEYPTNVNILTYRGRMR